MIKVWAPKAKKVSLLVNNEEMPMVKGERGYWLKDINIKQKAVQYAFKVNGRGPFPDPRSRFQSEGIHGCSQTWQEDFNWTDKDWTSVTLENAIIYELHVGTFSQEGNFAGVEKKLDYLKDLGVTHIELLPVADFPGARGWGYDGVDLFAPHHLYGTPDDLKHLVNACHKKGLGVILDVVYNHLGPDGNYLGIYGEYFSKRYHTPWGEAVNFDCSHSDEVRKFVIDNALMWLRDFHFDGLRIDAVHQIYDFSAIHILEEMQLEVEILEKETNKNFFLIAESDLNDPRLVRPRKQGGYELAGQWMDDFHHALHVMLTNEKHGYYQDFNGWKDLDKSLKENFCYDARYSKSRKCRHGRSAKDLPCKHFVVFCQNHDQVGNRGFGERLIHLTSFENCQFAAAMVLLSPFVPMLFQGEEWACSSPFLYFTDHKDEKLAEAVRKGRQRDYAFLHQKVPDPQAEETYKKSCLDWAETKNKYGAKMLEWYKRLVKLRHRFLAEIRKSHRELKPVDKSKKIFVYSAGKIKILFNSSKRDRIVLSSEVVKGTVLLQNKEFTFENGKTEILPGTVAVLSK
jgi:maltooligosyltrehalose trehalohydrolase